MSKDAEIKSSKHTSGYAFKTTNPNHSHAVSASERFCKLLYEYQILINLIYLIFITYTINGLKISSCKDLKNAKYFA